MDRNTQKYGVCADQADEQYGENPSKVPDVSTRLCTLKNDKVAGDRPVNGVTCALGLRPSV